MIDGFASMGHFADHVGAVLAALPDEHRGSAIARGDRARDAFRGHGLDPVDGPTVSDRPVLVASYGDLSTMRRHGRTRVVLMEHGAGQSYGGDPDSARHPSYAGGQRRHAALFLHPGPHPAARDRAVYPDAAIEVIGSPLLETLPAREPGPGPVIAITTHFDATISPEAQSAFAWARAGIPAIAGRYQVLGHGHPRIIDRLTSWYGRHGIEVVRDFRDVCRRADVLIADNTSALFAFAATGRPVVVWDPPFYRRDRHHGVRFWEGADVGVRVSRPLDLADAVAEAIEDAPIRQAMREAALDQVYGYRTGATKRAADVISGWLQ